MANIVPIAQKGAKLAVKFAPVALPWIASLRDPNSPLSKVADELRTAVQRSASQRTFAGRMATILDAVDQVLEDAPAEDREAADCRRRSAELRQHTQLADLDRSRQGKRNRQALLRSAEGLQQRLLRRVISGD